MCRHFPSNSPAVVEHIFQEMETEWKQTVVCQVVRSTEKIQQGDRQLRRASYFGWDEERELLCMTFEQRSK